MNSEEQDYMDRFSRQANEAIESERLRRQQIENQYTKDSAFPQADAKNIIEYQLDSNRLLDKAFHLLSGHVLKKGEDGNDLWDEPKDDRLKIFSTYGVERIMNLLSFYVTPEIVLSVFDLDTINREVCEFGIELADLIANKYELFFHYPQPEELFDRLKGIETDFSDEELYYKCVEWSGDELKMKLANYPVICQSIISLVHANYRRALMGETLKSLRTFTHVSQNLGEASQIPTFQPPKSSVWRPSTWGK